MAKPQILIVEDESIVALDLRRRLSKLGYAVCAITGTGEAAISQAEKMGPDLVLMDIRLKGKMNGLEAAQKILTQFSIPVIVLTALVDKETLHQAQAIGASDFIPKPFDEGKLYQAIETVLNRRR